MALFGWRFEDWAFVDLFAATRGGKGPGWSQGMQEPK